MLASGLVPTQTVATREPGLPERAEVAGGCRGHAIAADDRGARSAKAARPAW